MQVLLIIVKICQIISDLGEAAKEQSRTLTMKIHDFSDIFTGIGCSKAHLQATGTREQPSISNPA